MTSLKSVSLFFNRPEAINRSIVNIKEQGEIIKKQVAIIEKLQQRLDEIKGFRDILGGELKKIKIIYPTEILL